MSKLYITEYAQEGMDALGRVMQVAKEPAIATQAVTVSGTSAQSDALNAGTTLVRLHTDVSCSVLFGTDPTATATHRRLGPNQTEYVSVMANSGLKVAVIAN